MRIYYVGNSLTWDSEPGFVFNSLTSAGFTVEQGYHIACGASLAAIASRPDYTCVEPPAPYGAWTNALANYEWDAITIQAYPGATGAEEVAATRRILEIATAGDRNKNCKFFLFLGWPQQNTTNSLAELMQAPFEGDTAPVFLCSAFLDYWYRATAATFPELDVRTIPTGLAYARIDRKLSEINIGRLTNAYSLYRDQFHMNFYEGRHVARVGMVCALQQVLPDGMSFPSSYGIGLLDKAAVDLFHEAISSTFAADPRTRITATPRASVRWNPVGNTYECSFIGKLFTSEDMVNWTQNTEATSPHRFHPVLPRGFFRAGQ